MFQYTSFIKQNESAMESVPRKNSHTNIQRERETFDWSYGFNTPHRHTQLLMQNNPEYKILDCAIAYLP